MQHHILWIEGRRAKTPPFPTQLRERGYQVVTVPTGKAALEQVLGCDPSVTVLNAASMGTSGARILGALREALGSKPLVLIQNGPASERSLPADEILQLPFTIRKLENRLRRLLPCESVQVLKSGRLTLDPAGHTVQVGQRMSVPLTPLTAALLKELMAHAGEVVPRERLFCRIWETDYTGDTRTLDVYFSWLRKAIEKDPRSPHLIRTIRGVGYRLDV
jgi:two-component system alkaline phosphatase synthesis response regulator PhoP